MKNNAGARFAHRRRCPTTADVRELARRRSPVFAFEFMDGGAGVDAGIAKNWAALDAIDVVPRYGRLMEAPDSSTMLFGRRYASPFGIAPMAAPSLVFPGADSALARAAQTKSVPYIVSTMAGIDVERASELAPDVLWFQLSRCPLNDHTIGFDLVRRAHAAGVHVLVVTIDSFTRTVRPREVRAGITVPFRITPRVARDALLSPRWLYQWWRRGQIRFPNFDRYMAAKRSLKDVTMFLRRETTGSAFSWAELARYRDRWKGPMVLKGVLHPEDAEQAIALGVDGIIVSNHGGRQVEALPAAIDVLPSIVEQVSGRLNVMLDSGIRSGQDIARAIALGANAAFAGKAFLWGLGGLGDDGPMHIIDLLHDELNAALGQFGCRELSDLRTLVVRRRTC